MKVPKFWAVGGAALAALVPVIVVVAALSAQAQTYSVLYSFGWKRGAYPSGGVVRDWKGNLYGTTSQGGAYDWGVVFRVTPNGNERVLHSFTGGTDGGYPSADLVRDTSGNLYGTTYRGGDYGEGVVFKLDRTGAYTVLHSFNYAGGEDGMDPDAGVVRDSAGNLYGTTSEGGAYQSGVVFKLDTSGAETVLHSFNHAGDGTRPVANLVRDKAGTLYGTTLYGGAYGSYGVVFELKANGNEKVLYSFSGGVDGAWPDAGLVRDPVGNLYGTTSAGGAYGVGVVFKLDRTGIYTVLHNFNRTDGCSPVAALMQDSAGNLYGTTSAGGAHGGGVVFKLDATGAYSVLYSFTGYPDGFQPSAGLVRDSAGNLYGTTYRGGAHKQGVVFKITPQ